ncbi:hypothetical protein [Lentzea sp. NPDC059081]|uniref:hypothetical protein n=1 Tax=Lentzea sp. NPDC059081 TaxID=3346719 RepID=UPI0036BDD8A4
MCQKLTVLVLVLIAALGVQTPSASATTAEAGGATSAVLGGPVSGGEGPNN